MGKFGGEQRNSCPRIVPSPTCPIGKYRLLQRFALVIRLRFKVYVTRTPLMAEAVDQVQHDFWRPPLATVGAGTARERTSTCHCGSEFLVSSLYCHACGAIRPGTNDRLLEVPGLAELNSLGERLGLNTPAVVAFLAGALCVVGALSVSLFFSVRTVLDWQAIQLWRIEWLVAAVAAFVAGLLLKK